MVFNKNAAYLSLFFFIFIFFPTFRGGGQYVTFSIIAALMFTVIVSNLEKSVRGLGIVVFTLILSSLSSVVTMLLNNSEIRLGGSIEVLKPLFFMMIAAAGYYLGSLGVGVYKKLEGIAKIVLVGQIIFSIDQMFQFNLLAMFADYGKSKPFGGLVRSVGSVGNPNFFAWIVLQMTVILVVISSIKKNIGWIIIAFGLVVLSGSRTMLLMFPVALFFSVWLSGQRKVVSPLTIKVAVIFLFLLFLGLNLLSNFKDTLPYLAQLLNIVNTGELSSINSFAARLDMWEERYDVFESGGILALFFGLGPIELYRIVDNDFLYVFFRFGLFGSVLMYSFYMFLLVLLWKDRSKMSSMLIVYLTLSIVVGVQSDTLSGWYYPVIFYLYVGIWLKLRGGRCGSKNLYIGASSSV